jgi:hypothetical protein
MLEDIKEMWFHYVDRIEMDQGRCMWWALMIMVMKLRVP